MFLLKVHCEELLMVSRVGEFLQFVSATVVVLDNRGIQDVLVFCLLDDD